MINVKRKCPCCNKSFSFKRYLSQIFNFKVKKLNDKDKNIVCIYCKNDILSSEENNKFYFALIPFFFFIDLLHEIIFRNNHEIYYSLNYFLVLILILSISIFLVYLYAPLECKKKS